MTDILKRKGLHLLEGLIIAALLFCIIPAKLASAYIQPESDNQLKVHFIDVGDADSILIQQGNSSMLIDAGNNKDSDIIKEYLNKQGINRLDILVATHIHEDHIGAMDFIIDNFDIGKIYMPKSEDSNKDLESVLLSIKNKGLEFTTPVAGETFKIDEADCTILAPSSMGYERLNDYSIVIKLQYGSTSFLFTGDAESKSENEMMRRGLDLSADVLKLAHHGSATSTSKEFLERVNPKYAVLTAEAGSKYNHPHKNTIKRLKERNIKLYRTDVVGTIVAVSDGKQISFGAGTFDGVRRLGNAGSENGIREHLKNFCSMSQVLQKNL
jgi:competence protein ComEC